MYIIWRLVCENLSRITIKISFLWGPKHGVYAAASFSTNVTSWCSRNGTKLFTIVILHMNIIFIAQWLFGGNSEMLPCSNVFARRQKLYKPENIFKQTRVNFFYRENMTSFLNYVTATLRALFAWRGSYHVPVDFVTPPIMFEAVYCFICGRQRVAADRYRMICLVLYV